MSFFGRGGGTPQQQPYQRIPPNGPAPVPQNRPLQPPPRPPRPDEVFEKPVMRSEPQTFTVVKNAHVDIVRGNK
jgi:hypothetical protein